MVNGYNKCHSYDEEQAQWGKRAIKRYFVYGIVDNWACSSPIVQFSFGGLEQSETASVQMQLLQQWYKFITTLNYFEIQISFNKSPSNAVVS